MKPIFFLRDIFSDLKNLHYRDFVVDRVYDKSDPKKRPVLYVYMDLDGLGKKFYFADKEKEQMVELSEKEFDSTFECYQYDLENYNGIRPWKKSTKQKDILKNSKENCKEGDEK